MDRNAEVLARIIAEMTGGMENSRKAQAIAEKISQGKATYADALEYAQESGRVMNGSLRKNLPEVLTNGMLYRADADQVVRKPMQRSGEQVAEVAAEIQQYLNEEAGIGIQAITPEVNEDQITGIITDICNAESYEAGKERLFTQIENFLEGTVDDCVRENADFQYKAGLSPKIVRRAMGKCCQWCERLAGTYEYDDVSDRGNDVFRRHKNCHCIVSYNPGDGAKRRQNVHSKQWTNEDRDDRIAFAKRGSDVSRFNTNADPMREVYGPGEKSHPEEIKKFREEAAQNGVQIIEREKESLAYSPGLRKGEPGILYISKDASYSAWLHEIQHMRDDRAAGWSGMKIMEDLEECYMREERAYKIEIDMAKADGRDDIAQRLKDNLEMERRHIYGLN